MRLGSMPVLALVLLASSAASVRAQGDHPLLKPFTGSALIGQEVAQFNEQQIVIGPVQGGVAKVERLEGKVTRLDYQDPGDRSSLERVRNYEQALAAGGFEIVYHCSRDECGPETQVATIGYFPPDRYVAARLRRPEGDAWVAVAVAAGPSSRIWIVEVKPMETGLVSVSAGALDDNLSATGHVAVYGIYFDTGKSDLKSESDAALKEIAALLARDAALALHVVGHTDNVGALEGNLDLSTRRAAAVVTALSSRHGVAVARLRASGVGPLAPVASNATEAGRARNRRVELVAQ